MPTFYMMCGLPGSGKSTQAKKMAEKLNAYIFSSDAIRKEKYGDEAIQGNPNKIFSELISYIKIGLYAGRDVILDATNISYKKRMSFLRNLSNMKRSVRKVCVLMATPYEMCCARNASRERVVPEEVIKRMYHSFFIPAYFEGWDDIEVIYPEEKEEEEVDMLADKYLVDIVGFSQDNLNHSLTLDEHLLKARKYIDEKYSDSPILTLHQHIIRYAATYHDIGKPATKFFKPNDSVAHYYNHENVSAYMSLFIFRAASAKTIISIASLICYHMTPYVLEHSKEETKERYKKMFGEEFYHDLMILHEADVAAY